MSTKEKALLQLESRLAGLLHFGTWAASILIGLGLASILLLGRSDQSAHPTLAGIANDLVKGGIGLFILLPVSRVAVMLALFFRQRDYRFVAIAALVLLIIAVSLVLGMFASHSALAG